ncbi:hypothetical protein DITRI_Ditri10aG0038500 [Diplodiscus trichospermus]
MLWEAFNGYGKVVYVFINCYSRKPFTYAFVRYKLEEECRRTVLEGNGRCIDGHLISVKEALYGWKERRAPSALLKVKKTVATIAHPKLLWKERDHRMFKEVLVKGSKDEAEGVAGSGKDIKEDVRFYEKNIGDCLEEVTYNVDITEKDTEWMQFCAFRRLKHSVCVDDVW